MNIKGRRETVEDSTTDDTDTKWTRHPEFYMEDGSVVLLAENTLFRVYLKWLGKHSDVFAQMSAFGSVQPPDAETYDDLPLVRLTDSAEDLVHFFNGMDGCSSYFSATQPTPFRAVAGVLRLASKYMVTSLREKAIQHLCRLYPTKFEDMTPDHKVLRQEVFGSSSDGPDHPILLVNLLRSCQVTILLPWAYYAVVRWSFRDIITGFKLPGGSTVRLSEDDMRICLLGFETLLTKQHANIKHVLQAPVSNCKSYGSCSDAINDAFTRALDEHGTGLVAPLGQIRRKVSACDRCVANINRMDEGKRKEVWEDLPSVFSLPSWAELSK